ncbi:sensor histidine kinase [Zymomonas mobilis]|uniref:histidine kinase n=1 Tax=Zymomonas mobilis subsp. pomaceae (strain ATCC 29192 / DSM 22645 / JCM 10191 / CCUG 17912 / NBRC 13757 / NCIMB 11200 / NRRL B-4491 / Barker I) TaxID=579138 RepID=F8EU10_ZYMMT|nr:PAS domain-containing sensor histidine kinase [Zymomonas mobilis]AEI37090.1 histidine kinase [Zymomonas mobilis subsp. pomaceae ATCC 29192]MDX5948461.1 PAS-domain containing protein [Zymomonas mobilis subsp. pomaceae]GEB89474.1 hypothetical protein ZMO02_11110 [Zymomonas mobilis subsp. pomaceae]
MDEGGFYISWIVVAILIIILTFLWGITFAIVTITLIKMKKAQAVLQNTKPFQEIYRTAPIHGFLINQDHILPINPTSASWLGIPKIPDFLKDFLKIWLTPLSANHFNRHFMQLVKTGKGFTEKVESQIDNRLFRVVGYPFISSSKFLNKQPNILIWVSDITEDEDVKTELKAQQDQAYQALQALSSLFEVMPFPIWYRAKSLKLLLVNSAYVSAVEAKTGSEVITYNIELLERNGAEKPLSFAEKAVREQKLQNRLSPVITGGARRMMRLTDIPLPSGAVAGYAMDVEELEEAKAEMGRFLQAQRHILDQLSAGVAQFNAEQNLIFSNQPFRHLFALKPEWLVDRPEFDRVLERMREAGRLPAAHDFPAWKAERRQWFLAHSEALEENWLLSDGSHLRVITQPTPDGGLLLIFEDRTEQVRLTSAHDIMLRVRTASFDKLFEAISVFSSDGRLNLWNTRFTDVWQIDEKLLSLHPRVDELAKLISARLTDKNQPIKISEAIRMTTVERQSNHGHLSFADGQYFNFSTVPLPDGNVLFTMLDVTDSWHIERALRDRNEALEAADRLKTDFVANMSYELRTPLTSISGFAEMLAQGYCGDLSKTATDYVTAILDAVARLSALIDDILDLTLLESGNLELNQQNLILKPLLANLGKEVSERASELGVTLEIVIDDNLGEIESDPKRLQRTITHMLLIALARNPRGGTVIFKASGEAEKVTIMIIDEGDVFYMPNKEDVFASGDQDIGIKLSDHFSAYGQAVHDGRGSAAIAIPLIRRFIALHGGTIRIDSTENQKTHFIITLPRHVPVL